MRPGVLIVDDDAIVRSVWAKLLEDNGFSTVEAKDGIEAIEKLSAAQEGIHVILLDRMMPRMTGDEFLKHIINTHRCHVSVIMITAYDSEESKLKFYGLRSEYVIPHRYIPKPSNWESLLSNVRSSADSAIDRRNNTSNSEMSRMRDDIQRLHENTLAMQRLLAELPTKTQVEGIRAEMAKHNRSFLSEIGMDLIRALVIAAAIVAILSLGLPDLIQRLIGAV